MTQIPDELIIGLDPEKKQMAQIQKDVGESVNKLLWNKAVKNTDDIWNYNDDAIKAYLRNFLYYYLICYTRCCNLSASSPQTTSANELLLQTQNEELERNLKILTQKYNKLMNQTSNAVDVTKYTQLVEQFKTLQGTLSYEQNQRANAEEKLDKITAQRDTLVETVEANREKLENYSKLQESLKKSEDLRKSTANYATTLQKENEELKEQLQQFENLSKNKKMVKAINSGKENKQLQSEIEELQKQNDELKKQNDKYRSAEEKNSGSLELKEQLITKLKQDRDNANAAKNKAENDLILLQQKFDEQKKVLSNAGSARTDLYSESYEKQLREKDREIRKLKEQLEMPDKLQNLHKNLYPDPAETQNTAELESLRNEINELNNQLSQKNAEIIQLKNAEIPDNSAELDSLREQLQQEKDSALQNLRSQLEQEKDSALQELERKYQQDLQDKNAELDRLHSDLASAQLEKSQLEKTNQDLTAKQSAFHALQSEVSTLRSQVQTAQEEAKKEEIKQQAVSELSPDMKIAVSDTELDNQPDAEFYNVREAMTGDLTFQESDELRAPIVIIHGKAYPNAYYYRNLLTGQGMGGMETLKNIFDFENVGNTSVCILAEFIPAVVSEDGEIRLLKRGKLIMK